MTALLLITGYVLAGIATAVILYRWNPPAFDDLERSPELTAFVVAFWPAVPGFTLLWLIAIALDRIVTKFAGTDRTDREA